MKNITNMFVAIAAMFAATPVFAATDTDWIGGDGGSESEPLDIYQAANWSSGKLPSDAYHLKFSVNSQTYLTNSFASATTTRIADNIYPNSGDFVFLGPFRFYTLNNTVANATASIVKKGDWWIDYFFYGGGAQGSKTVLTNEYGNMTVSQQNDAFIANGNGAQFDIVSKAGNWSFSNKGSVYFANGQNSSVRIEKEGGDWTSNIQVHFGRGSGSTARFINRGGKFTVSNYLIVGSGGTGYLDIEGGEVVCSATYLGVGEAGPGTVTVKTGGKFTGTSQQGGYSIYLGSSSGTGTLNVEGGEVSLSSTAGSLALCLGTHDASVSITDGGLVTAPAIKHVNGAGRGTVTIDNGTIKALMDNAAFIPANDKLFVYVGSNGGTIDTNAKNITIAEPLLEDSSSTGGGMTFKGGGTVTLAGGNTYTGATVVELGTTVEVSSQSDIPGSIAVSIPESGLTPGKYTILKTSGPSAFTSTLLDSIAAEEDCEFAVSDGGKTVACIYKRSQMAAGIWLGTKNNDLCDGDNWSDGAVPNGTAATISCAVATTLVCSGTFSPSGITFPADSALVTVSGPGAISGISSIVNNTSLHHVFNCQVACPDGITPSMITRTEPAYMTFAGGITMFDNPKTGGGTTDYWSGKIDITTTASQQYTTGGNVAHLIEGTTFSFNNGVLDRMLINQGATAVVDRLVYNGCCRVSNKGWYSTVFDNGDGVLRAGEIRAEVDAVLFHSYADSDMGGGTIIADKLTCAQASHQSGKSAVFQYAPFHLNCGSVNGTAIGNDASCGEGVWVIGPGGLAFGDTVDGRAYYEVNLGKSIGGRPAATLHSFADWTLRSNPNGGFALAISGANGGFLVIDTSHYMIGEPEYDSATSHDVTLTGFITGAGGLRVVGSGRVIFDSVSSLSGELTISNAATVAVNKDCTTGSGPVTVTSGATFALPQSGEVTIPGAVTLQDGAILSFYFTSADAAPKFKFTNAAGATVESGGTVAVKVSAAEDLFMRRFDSKWLIATNVTGSFALDEATKPTWAESVSVEDGNLYLLVKTPGLSLSVR